MEALLRLDAAIEPYSRAIVLLVLLAAAAFTLLLLRVQPAAIPAKASFVPAEPLAKSLPRELNPASVPDTPPPETRPTIVKAPETPLAEGPASLHPSPPRATLEQEILPATTHALAESYDYPSAKLPAQVGGTLPSESTEGKPVEARLRPSVTPIHSYK